MGDLLKNMRSSQIFSVCGQPEVKMTRAPTSTLSPGARASQYQVELVG